MVLVTRAFFDIPTGCQTAIAIWRDNSAVEALNFTSATNVWARIEGQRNSIHRVTITKSRIT